MTDDTLRDRAVEWFRWHAYSGSPLRRVGPFDVCRQAFGVVVATRGRWGFVLRAGWDPGGCEWRVKLTYEPGWRRRAWTPEPPSSRTAPPWLLAVAPKAAEMLAPAGTPRRLPAPLGGRRVDVMLTGASPSTAAAPSRAITQARQRSRTPERTSPC